MDLERLKTALADRYDVQRELGRGGMATVYLARDLKHDRPVAIKVLHPELTAGLGAERFVREIKISARLTHPHILPLFDSGEADGFLYYVMPYLEGESLKDRLEREGKLPVEDAIRLTEQVSSALAYAHERGVVHRDIEPANILLTADQAIVADFGIARALEAASTEGLTMTGMAVGKPAYMSPEQAAGEKDVDARTDVYGLGCVVYEMVSGGLPFEGTGPQVVATKQVAERVRSLRKTDPGIPVWLDRAVSRALATKPADRFATAGDFADALTTGTIAPRVRAQRARQVRRAAFTGAAMAVLVVAAWSIWTVMGGRSMERLAVLPLEDLSDDPEQEFLAAGVHEALIAELGRLGLSVTARTSMLRYRDTEKGIGEVADELGVDGVIEGSVFRGGDSLEIATRLYDREEREIWRGSFDGVLPNIVALYRGFARAIAHQIRLSLSAEAEARLGEAAPVDPAVYEAYLRGMHLLNNPRTDEDIDTAIGYFSQAVEQNPADPRAHAGLALGYTNLGHGPDPPDDAFPRARAAAERSIRLDSTLAEGWAALAHLKYYSPERDWEGAERAFRRANELNPSLADVHYHYAWYLAFFGRVEEALVAHVRAQELDPLNARNTVWIPALHWFSGDNERALREAREIIEQYPRNATAHYVLGESAARLGLFDEAIAAHEQAVTFWRPWKPYLGHTYARAGRTEDALRIVEELEAQPSSGWNAVGLSFIHAALGSRDEAFRWMEYEPPHSWAITVASYPQFESYRDEPRFRALLRRMNLRIEPGDLAPTALPVVAPSPSEPPAAHSASEPDG